MIKKLLSFSFIFFILLTITFSFSVSADSDPYVYDPGFWHTRGSEIVDENGNAVQLKSMELYGTWWYDPEDPKRYGEGPTWDHDEDSYAELKSLGFNSVRLLMGYMFFEKEPYHYENTDWDWIDTNLTWAEKNDMKIIFTMDKPQGGTEYFEGRDSLFTNAEYQERFIKMWQCIAEHYKDCTTIAGWELMNEPLINSYGNQEKQYAVICDVLQRTINAIREVDQNHMIFCERCSGTARNQLAKYANKVFDKQNFYLYPYVEDYNLVQSFHCHFPHTFTMRYGIWDEYPGYYIFRYIDRDAIKEELLRIKGLFDTVYNNDPYPVFISEFCVKFRSDDIKKEQGYQWISDCMDIFNELGYSYSYDRYHSDGVGLWDAKTWQNYRKGTRDEVLAQIFLKHN